jgi:hypothetical protein
MPVAKVATRLRRRIISASRGIIAPSGQDYGLRPGIRSIGLASGHYEDYEMVRDGHDFLRFQTVVSDSICQTDHPLNAVFGETHKIMTVPIWHPSSKLKGNAFHPFELSAVNFQLK